jgi:hypothetical protein
LARGLI